LFDGGEWKPVPYYPKDLNAMHEAEKIFDKTQRSKYANELHDVILTEENEDDDTEIDFAWLSATAAQRAEAFLRTVGRWVES
jgi:hypothetical protein